MASTVQANCIKVLVKAGKIQQAVKLAVMANLEEGRHGGFFVGNAEYDALEAGMSKHQFAGGLAAMAKDGEYAPSDDPEYAGKYGYFIGK